MMTDTVPDDVPLIPNFRAAIAVICPKCRAVGGQPCQSTGGGNRADVVTHKARIARIAGLTNQVQDEAAAKVRTMGLRWYGRSHEFAAFEAQAAPIPVRTGKQPTPNGVRLSEVQAEEIERYVYGGGFGWVSTTHFHGDDQHRRTVNALEGKGIVEFVEPEDYGRRMKLTEFGWQVYRQHRLVIRRLSEEQIAEQVARAEQSRCMSCGMEPGVTADCEPCDLARFVAVDRARTAGAA